MSTPRIRRLPLECAPQPGEGFDGWLQRVSYLTCAFPADLLKHLNVTTGQQHLPGVTLHAVARELWTNLADATGTQPDDWAATINGPSVYAARVGQPSKPLAAFMGFRKASRFCPACLKESGGVWLWVWSVGWHLVCPIHNTLLTEGCPKCGGRHAPQRTPRHVVPGPPDTCQRPACAHETLGPATPRCGHSLTSATAPPAPAALVTLTRHLLPLTDPTTPADKITAAQRLLPAFAGLSHAAANTPLSDPNGDARSRKLHRISVAAAAALGDPDAFTRLAAPNNKRRCQPTPSHWTHVPEHLVEKAVTQRQPHLTTYDKMRWTCYIPPTRTPANNTDAVMRLVETLPGMLWPEWALRLIPDDFEMSDQSARLHACTLLTLPGWIGTTKQLVAAWPRPDVTAATTTRMLRLLNAHPRGAQCLQALSHLAQYLRDNPCPINYERRRQRLGSITIPTDLWLAWCEHSETPAGTGRKRLLAEQWVTRTLTVQPPGDEASGLDPQINTFARTMPEALRIHLQAHAQTLMDVDGLRDEPMTWTPPPDAVPQDLWCGPDPATLIAETQPGSDPIASVRQANLLIEIGLLLDVPPPYSRRPKHITEAVLLDFMTSEGVNVREAAAKFGVNRKTITDRCHRHALPIRPAGRVARPVDPDLLRDLYLNEHLTIREIAEQTGISPTNVAVRLRHQAVPLRPRGGASHRNHRAADGLPKELAQALTGQAGMQRVQRFQHVAAAPSINQAAKRLGISQATLTQQIHRIERAVGGPILNRNARNNQPHTLTPLGTRLLRQANRALGDPVCEEGPLPIMSTKM